MIHRAIFGSFERMFGILTENFAGKWPFWLSPRQILIIPIMSAVNGEVLEVQKIFKENMIYVDVDMGGNTLQEKIRTGQIEQYKLYLVRNAAHTFVPPSADVRSYRTAGAAVAYGQYPKSG